MTHHTVTVTDDSEGIRLDRFLASVLPQHSRSQIQRLIKEGLIHVAGRGTKANQPVKAGQAISIELPEPVDPVPQPEALPLPIQETVGDRSCPRMGVPRVARQNGRKIIRFR